jgi:uncharacterized membrane protein YdjX (TVP38/TMEM64 family)
MNNLSWLERFVGIVPVFFILALIRSNYDPVVAVVGIALLIIGAIAFYWDRKKDSKKEN